MLYACGPFFTIAGIYSRQFFHRYRNCYSKRVKSRKAWITEIRSLLFDNYARRFRPQYSASDTISKDSMGSDHWTICLTPLSRICSRFVRSQYIRYSVTCWKIFFCSWMNICFGRWTHLHATFSRTSQDHGVNIILLHGPLHFLRTNTISER